MSACSEATVMHNAWSQRLKPSVCTSSPRTINLLRIIFSWTEWHRSTMTIFQCTSLACWDSWSLWKSITQRLTPTDWRKLPQSLRRLQPNEMASTGQSLATSARMLLVTGWRKKRATKFRSRALATTTIKTTHRLPKIIFIVRLKDLCTTKPVGFVSIWLKGILC